MLSIGIVGLPNVGKSTLYSALTKKQVEVANYPFATIDPNVGVVEVPDERLDKIAQLSQSAQKIPTAIEFVDIAGLVKGAHEGEGLGNKFLANISAVDAICYVVRAFAGGDVRHVEDSVDPMRDIETIRSELALKDLDVIERRIDKKEGEARSGDAEAKKHLDILQKLAQALNEGEHVGEFLRKNTIGDKELKLVNELQLLTAKPAIYVFNAHNTAEIPAEAKKYIEETGSEWLALNIREELDSADLNEEERKELGLKTKSLDELIAAAYRVLGLITFFTTGEKETRAWTTRDGSTARAAAGVIHSDFEQMFIRAEVISWDVLIDVGGWSQARTAGELRTEGKGYIVQDGDVMLFLHG